MTDKFDEVLKQLEEKIKGININPEANLRMQCLAHTVSVYNSNTKHFNIVEMANEFYNFVKGKKNETT